MAAGLFAVSAFMSAVSMTGQAKASSAQSDYYRAAQEQTRRQKQMAMETAQAKRQEYRQQAETYEHNVDQIRHNMTLLDLEGDLDQTMTARQVNQLGRRGQAMISQVMETASRVSGKQVTGAAASNVLMEGTPALLLAKTAAQAVDDAADIERATALQIEDSQFSAFSRGMSRLNQAAGLAGQAVSLYGAANGAYRGASNTMSLAGLESSLYDLQSSMYGAQAKSAQMQTYASMFRQMGDLAWSGKDLLKNADEPGG